MFDLYGCYFMYGDFNSEEYDLVFGNMDTSRLVALESPKNINTVKSRKHNVYYVNRVSYVEEPISFEAEIFTKDTTPIMVDDLPIIERALFNRHSYTKLYQVMSYERDPVYINCILTNPERIENMSGVVGYKFIVNTDSVMAWEETNTQEVNEESTSTTITGDIVSFTDTKEYALKQAIVDIDCVQDLHGYDHSWAGGAGVNILPPMVDGTYEGNGVKAVVKDGIATLSGTTTSSGNALIIPLAETITAPASFYYHMGNSEINASLAPAIENSADTNQNVNYACSPANRITGEITNKVGQTYDRIRFYIANGITIAGTYAPMFCLDNVARSYTPYSNICPISGWDEVNVYNDSKYGGLINWNQLIPHGNFDDGLTTGWSAYSPSHSTVSVKNNHLTLTHTATSNREYGLKTNTTIIAGHKYIVTGWYQRLVGGTDSDSTGVVIWLTGGTTQKITVEASGISRNDIVSLDKIFESTTSNTAIEIHFAGLISTSANDDDMMAIWNVNLFDLTEIFGAEKADEIYAMEQEQAGAGVAWFKNLFPKDYYEYNEGEQTCVSAVNDEPYWHYTTDLDDACYGGTLDVTTGLLTVTHRFIEVSECASVSTASTDVKYAQISFGTGNGADADHSTNVSSKYIQVESAPETDGYYRIVSSYLYIYDNRFTDQTTANSILSAEKPQFVYKLANPQTYQLDPRQVYTIVGNNNIWSDTGNITISYNQTNDFHIDVDTDLDDYIYPDVEIQVGGEGGDIVIYNATDDATRFTEFSSVPPFTTFTMQGSINHITNGMYNHFTSRNFIRLLNGRNNFFMYGDIERITFRFNNRKYM